MVVLQMTSSSTSSSVPTTSSSNNNNSTQNPSTGNHTTSANRDGTSSHHNINTVSTTTSSSVTMLHQLLSLGPKWLTLIAFVIHNVVLIVTFRACSIKHASQPSSDYIASTVVVFTELMKLLLSLLCCFYLEAQGKSSLFVEILTRAFLDDGLDVLKLCLPAILYAIQNNLQYVIESAPLFLVLYQCKIVTTAVFYSHMLAKKRMTIKEWASIVALAIGASMVESSQHDILPHHASNIVGMISVAVACLTSGFAGVYFEKVLKDSRSSIWVINIQLSMMSFSFAMILSMSENPEEIIKFGIFKGFDFFVMMVVVLQALTGLGVALVVKYSDNLHKGFSATIAIVIGSVVNAFLFHDTSLNSRFFMGAIFVLGSSIAYASIMHPNSVHHSVHHALEEGHGKEGKEEEEDIDEEELCYNYCLDYVQSHCAFVARWLGDKNNK